MRRLLGRAMGLKRGKMWRLVLRALFLGTRTLGLWGMVLLCTLLLWVLVLVLLVLLWLMPHCSLCLLSLPSGLLGQPHCVSRVATGQAGTAIARPAAAKACCLYHPGSFPSLSNITHNRIRLHAPPISTLPSLILLLLLLGLPDLALPCSLGCASWPLVLCCPRAATVLGPQRA